ncbi:UDP-glucose/GDP-mannose dehydrogenase family protein [Candidatus Woesearchaeota archaeon]|nr:UDP-glucose/GDP-mannose dehydrogenase family protein [Candidatus Woesearchaeota archaeon]
MNISIIGSGYVGLVSAVCFAKKGHKVECVDVDKEKVDKINQKIPPIYEEGLHELLSETIDNKSLKATTNLKNAVLNSDITFIAVGTPSREDGSINLDYLNAAAKSIAETLKEKNTYHVIVVKSTVVPGTTDSLIPIIEQVSGKKCNKDFGIAMNPEFLKEGFAIRDFMAPDRIVIGVSDQKTAEVLNQVYAPFESTILVMSSTKAAEMVKYTSNSLLATKISFANEVGDICKKLGVDVYEVMKGVGLDHRLGPYFLNAGPGFGGSCFPKDVHALIAVAKSVEFNPKLLNAVLEVNHDQPYRVVELARKKGLRNNIAVLGLAFKPGTDDIRETPAITIIQELKKEGKHVIAYDPQAMDNTKKVLPDIEYTGSAKEAIDKAEMVIIVTHWDEFRNDDLYRGKVVIDARDIIKDRKDIDYEGLCW